MATAVQVESIWNGLTDNSGEPLASGKVYTYYAGTSTPVALFTASDKSTSATNPLILDGNGKAQVWADGRYKFVVKSAADVTLYTLDNLLYGFDDSTVLWGGQSTGSANTQTVSVPATVGVYSNGQRVSFIAGYTNTGPVTLQLNSLSAVSVVKGPNAVSLQAGDIVAGQLVDCVYEAYSGTGRFRLENYPTLADVQRSRFQVATNVSANSATVTADLTPALTSYEAGLAVRLKIVTTSSGPVTLNLNGLGAKTVQFNNAALVAGELQANNWHEFVYDGTQFQLLNPYEVAIPRWAGTTTGTSTAYAISPSPAITAYAAGQRFSFIAHAANGAAPTLAVSGLAATAIQYEGTALVSGEIALSGEHEVMYDGTAFQLLNPSTTASSGLVPVRVSQIQDSAVIYGGTSTGSANAQAISLSPDITAYTVGQRFIFKAGYTNTGATTLAVDSITPAVAIQRFGVALVGGEIQLNDMVEVVYNGTAFQLENSTPAPLFVDRTNNRVGIGKTSIAEALDISGNVKISAPLTDATQKIGRLIGAPYTNANGDWLAADIRGSSGSNELVFGGGSAVYKCATGISFITAANTTTTSGTERARILSSGEVLIGTATSANAVFRLQIGDQTGQKGVVIQGGSASTSDGSVLNFNNGTAVSGQIGNYSALQGGAYDGRFTIKNSGSAFCLLGLTAAVGTHFMKWNNVSGAWTFDTSSARYKDNIANSSYGLAEVIAMRPVTFTYKAEPDRHDVGFIAEEMLEVVPEVVAKNLEGEPDAISYDRLTSVLCKAIQELNAKVESLESRIAALEA